WGAGLCGSRVERPGEGRLGRLMWGSEIWLRGRQGRHPARTAREGGRPGLERDGGPSLLPRRCPRSGSSSPRAPALPRAARRAVSVGWQAWGSPCAAGRLVLVCFSESRSRSTKCFIRTAHLENRFLF
uniref:Uncharacterized protein n=1 Tax=Cairina moschata TaxID=8855 RepID=A0A8C3C2E4_CAIMO